MHLYSYNPRSKSAKALAQGLGISRIKHEGSRFKGGEGKLVINWGASSVPYEVGFCNILNQPMMVGEITNKLSFFELMFDSGFSDYIVPFTTDTYQVCEWFEEGKKVVVRHKLTGHSGEGIEILGEDDDVPHAPLYTMYKPKKSEWRVHCHKNVVFDIQRKVRDRDNPNPNWHVRNHQNGFIYARNDIDPPACVQECALKIFNASGLDFGAVDIIYNEQENRAYALEINTAPGLTGTTLNNYVQMFKENFL